MFWFYKDLKTKHFFTFFKLTRRLPVEMYTETWQTGKLKQIEIFEHQNKNDNLGQNLHFSNWLTVASHQSIIQTTSLFQVFVHLLQYCRKTYQVYTIFFLQKTHLSITLELFFLVTCLICNKKYYCVDLWTLESICLGSWAWTQLLLWPVSSCHWKVRA